MSSSLADPFEGDDEDEDDTNGEPPSKPLRETSRPGSIKRVSKNDSRVSGDKEEDIHKNKTESPLNQESRTKEGV